jgi:hypothetical protein
MKTGDWIVKKVRMSRLRPEEHIWTYPGKIVYIDDEYIDFLITGNEEPSSAKRAEVKSATKLDFDRHINDLYEEVLGLQEKITRLEALQKEVPNE